MGAPNRNKSAQSKADVKRLEAWKLHLDGHSCRAIAERIGVSKSSANDYIREARAEAVRERKDLAEGELEAQAERLSGAMQKLTASEAYQAGDPQAINAFVKVCESYRKLLGLDAPSKADVTSGGDKISTFKVVIPSNDTSDK